LESEWQKLSAYDPPSILSANWQISPPAYMKMENLKHEDFGYARAPEGSKISLELVIANDPENVGVSIFSDEDEFSVNQVSSNIFRYEKVLDQEWNAIIRLRNLDATHREPIDSESITFAPIPDEPPIVEITDPAKDLQLRQMPVYCLRFFLRTIMEWLMYGLISPMQVRKKKRPFLWNLLRKKKQFPMYWI
jgi:hypothetical protein